jgi:hypothetical protein
MQLLAGRSCQAWLHAKPVEPRRGHHGCRTGGPPTFAGDAFATANWDG